jgi:biofilm protein TabA
MILANLSDIGHQVVRTANMEKALQFLQNSDLKSLPVGRIEVDGSNVYAMISSYSTMVPGETLELEGHKKYIDIQYILSGVEMIGWASAENVPITKPYDEDKDFWIGKLPENKLSWLRLTKGQAAILYPCDAHAPQMTKSSPAAVKKIVIKVAL